MVPILEDLLAKKRAEPARESSSDSNNLGSKGRGRNSSGDSGSRTTTTQEDGKIAPKGRSRRSWKNRDTTKE